MITTKTKWLVTLAGVFLVLINYVFSTIFLRVPFSLAVQRITMYGTLFCLIFLIVNFFRANKARKAEKNKNRG